jgi:adenylate kinase
LLVAIDVPDQVIIERAVGTRVDPVTQEVYHPKYNPPPRNPLLEARLIQRSTDTEANVKARLEVYRRHLFGITQCYSKTLHRLSYSEGIFGNENTVVKDVNEITSYKKATNAPRQFKIIIQGPSGCGKSSVSRFIEREFGFIHGKM